VILSTRATDHRILRAAAHTARRSPPRPPVSAWPSAARGAGSFGSFRSVEGFYIAGGALAAWALILTAIGVTRENFPSTPGAARLVGLISIVLVVTAISLAVYLSANEEHEPEAGGENAALSVV
jgi:hypothetical protein